MNFLQLVNDFIRESGIGDPIVTVADQEDDYADAVAWVSDAYVEIQRNRLWNWRWSEGTFNTVIGQTVYTSSDVGLATDDEYGPKSAFLDGKPLSEVNHKSFKGLTSFTNLSKFISEFPDGSFHLNPVPAEVKAITFDQYAAPVVLTADGDVPAMAAHHHKAIIWKALEQYAREQGKEWSALYQAAIRNFNSIYDKMLEKDTGPISKSTFPF